jgi:hypothetical protein
MHGRRSRRRRLTDRGFWNRPGRAARRRRWRGCSLDEAANTRVAQQGGPQVLPHTRGREAVQASHARANTNAGLDRRVTTHLLVARSRSERQASPCEEQQHSHAQSPGLPLSASGGRLGRRRPRSRSGRDACTAAARFTQSSRRTAESSFRGLAARLSLPRECEIGRSRLPHTACKMRYFPLYRALNESERGRLQHRTPRRSVRVHTSPTAIDPGGAEAFIAASPCVWALDHHLEVLDAGSVYRSQSWRRAARGRHVLRWRDSRPGVQTHFGHIRKKNAFRERPRESNAVS